jgi:ABC-type ATPase with predicted acetyltransferase domain
MPRGKLLGRGVQLAAGLDEAVRALSNGGRFRVDLARTLAERPELAVVDEFGSLVHKEARTIAAVDAAKAVRQSAGRPALIGSGRKAMRAIVVAEQRSSKLRCDSRCQRTVTGIIATV